MKKFQSLQKGINYAGTWISDKADNLKNLNDVMEENEQLKGQVEELTNELNTIKLEQYELENLRELLALDQQYSDYKKTGANVIGKDPGNWFSVFTIDKGSKDGIEVDMNVIAGNGLVGIVIDVGPHYAKVRSVIDDSAKVYGFIRGAYHFFNSKTDPLKQANFFIENVKLEEDDLPPVLDIEQKVDDEEMLRRNVKIWLNCIENYYHKKPIIYASYRYKTRYLNDSTLNSYPYWIAHYYVDSVQYQGQWKFWQHTDVGTLPGIKENVDLDVFNGTMDELLGLTH